MSRGKNPTHAKKSLGQNFLVDQNYVQKVIAAADPQTTDFIIEIGPGRGAITKGLVDAGASVIAIELDRELAPQLEERFKTANNFRVIEADATQVDFSTIVLAASAAETSDLHFKVVANLPYYISTAILQHLASHREYFTTLVLMFQKEVVERITAQPGSSERGFLTVLTEAAFYVDRLFDVPPTAFRPVPKVTSSVVRLTPKPPFECDETGFRSLLSAAFAQKRKTLLNNLKQRYSDLGNVFERSGIDSRRRAESLSLDEWNTLFNAINEVD